MELHIGKELAALRRMPVNDLRTRYAELFGEATSANNRIWLIKRIAWRLQALAEGDLSERARQRAAELANEADLRLGPPPEPRTLPLPAACAEVVAIPWKSDDRLPMPGTLITRRYRDQTVQVKVLQRGFEYEGEVYRSLSAVAKAITGSHCNGYLFFQHALGGKGGVQ